MNANTEQLIACILFLLMLGLPPVALTWWHLQMRRALKQLAQGDTERIPRYAEKIPPLLVVAGTYREYEQYCAQQRLNRFHDAIFVDSVYRVPHGERAIRYALVGSYQDLPELPRIMAALTYLGYTQV